ncbi:MAG: hypothetical protein EOP53_01735 [Sphingobacteriales bacterium]|nr:MAG: hypothetical protein EOP53_01735 [Sphingobacteriales bacterium]
MANVIDNYFSRGFLLILDWAIIKKLAQVFPNKKTKIFEDFDHYSPEEKVNEISVSLQQFFFRNIAIYT